VDLASLPDAAQDLARTSASWGDRWWDPEAGLLWNPQDAFEELPRARSVHLVPQSAWYALALLLRGDEGDAARAARTIDAVVATQYDAPGTSWHGTFARFLEWPDPADGAREWVDYDPNWRQFIGTTFGLVLSDHAPAIPADLTDRMVAATDFAVRGEPLGRVAAWYSNIALMKAWLEVDHGTRTGDAALVAAGEALAGEVVERFDRHGAFEEYNSPTYYGIDLYALRLWRTRSPSASLRAWGARLEEAVWDDVGRFHHAGLRNLAGPWSRSYGMDMHRYLGALGLFTWAALGRDVAPVPDPDGPYEHSHDLFLGGCVALLGADISPAVADAHRRFEGPRLVRRQISSDPDRVATAWLDHDLAIGAEAGAGFAAWGQHHPAVIQWRAPDGTVAWLRVRHRAPFHGEAGERTLTCTCEPHPRHGPQPTTVEVRAPGLSPDAVGAGRWDLPGLTAAITTDAAVAAVERTGEATVTVRYEPLPRTARWHLEVVDR
jgi:hypothetical protein